MDTMQQGIITLLKSAITGEKLPLSEEFDIDSAYSIIKRHHMTALVYAGAINCGIDQKKAAMQQLFQSYCKALQVSERQMRALAKLFSAFDEEGIDYLPVKGCVMKALYPKPELRMMGDADILIRMEQYDRIVPMMKELGYSEDKEDEQHFIWKSDFLCVELHKRLIKPNCEGQYSYFQNSWKYAEAIQGTKYAMDEENTFAFLFTHFARHYSSAGIGCRHVVDLWVYLRSHPKMDETYLKTIMLKLNLWEFYQNIRRLIAVWFEDAALDEKSEFISNIIFSNGSWGSADNATLNSGVWNMGKSGSAFRIRAKYIWRLLFPDVMSLKEKYPILQKHSWLLPAVWCVRGLRKIVSVRSIWAKHSRTVHMLNKEKLADRKEMLQYVGLIPDEEINH